MLSFGVDGRLSFPLIWYTKLYLFTDSKDNVHYKVRKVLVLDGDLNVKLTRLRFVFIWFLVFYSSEALPVDKRGKFRSYVLC